VVPGGGGGGARRRQAGDPEAGLPVHPAGKSAEGSSRVGQA
jgi:hypothetical protein